MRRPPGCSRVFRVRIDEGVRGRPGGRVPVRRDQLQGVRRSLNQRGMSEKIRNHTQLEVYRRAMQTAMELFSVSKTFPREEMYSLTDQIRRSSRSVCANLAEAWRKRRYEGAFVSKLSDAEAEAAETQVWIEFAVKCGYVEKKTAKAWLPGVRSDSGNHCRDDHAS